MGRPLILWLNDVNRESVSTVGGKSANLGEMLQIGVPVPDGFAVTADAYRRFLEKTGAAQEIKQYIDKLSDKGEYISKYQEASKALRRIIEEKEIPGEIVKAICSNYQILCEKYGTDDLDVAVRSSGLAEDMSDASFAGQYESFLNVRGKEELMDKTRQCWSSQFTVRAMSYRKKMKLPIAGDLIGITVLKMVCARSAGVGFTAHPLTGDRSKIVLEGNWGLGESIVQGLVSPDRYVIDKETLELIEKSISEKDRLVRYAEQGIVEDVVAADKQNHPSISDEEAVKLAEFAKTLEIHYGTPQDVEWAIDPDLPFPENIYLVQTRPITVSADKDESEKADYLVDLMIQMVRQVSDAGKNLSSPNSGKNEKKT